ncbi:hypothetical protein M378DRAFT_172321 [Amanita muscaria Koide BX008]|uniref:Uncharacterized protein n=1 Tax=Amanita muscaria (strain Koide BX008) TaxID=946122 RepID=A0A0C2S2I4_AMAMK|nr:hypothetical protein M378DRAFT_173546 [Amanita muscaria Koide BX008]KIL56875.1 hypothetical protein M378DRAFT_172321 [Amanita muscaria Koide BX008]
MACNGECPTTKTLRVANLCFTTITPAIDRPKQGMVVQCLPPSITQSHTSYCLHDTLNT